MTSYQNIQIICVDDYQLTGRFYQSQKKDQKSIPVLIAPATGITANFYHSFATWLAEQGNDVLSFDFRGIGESLHGPLKHSKANIVQWGQLDLPAAIEYLLTITHANKVILLGHSAGGQLTGIIPNYDKIAKVVAISSSSGYLKGLRGHTKQLAPIMFKGIFPVARYILGYGPTKMLGMGENLPKDVAKQWGEFCSKPGYVFNAIGKTIPTTQDYHRKILQPITVLYSSDDEIATEANIKDLLRLYPNAQTAMFELNPNEFSYKSIGHMLMFKRSHQNLWPIIQSHLIH